MKTKSTDPEPVFEHVHGSLYTVNLSEQSEPDAALERLKDSPHVALVEPDPVVKAFQDAPQADPEVYRQWAHDVVRSQEAWGIHQGSRKVVVGIIDTGVDANHPDLKANMWKNPGEVAGNGKDDDGNGYVDDIHGWDFVNNDNAPNADDAPNYHGTHVAGIIGAVGGNGIGISGHAPQVSLMALKFLDAKGYGRVSAAIRAIHYAIEKKADILNNSWGGSQGSIELDRAITKAQEAGVLFVAAAGNGGPDGIADNNDQIPTYPAVYPQDIVISVAATDRSDQLTRFSNFGPKSVDLAAPGADIYSAQNGGGYQNLSGTSMATPLVSGVLAVMKAARPDASWKQLKAAILESVDSVPALQGRMVSGGRVNAYHALLKITDGELPPDPQPTPTPTPTHTPGPWPPDDPPPSQNIAKAPLLAGQMRLVVTNPYVQVPVSFDLTQFTSAGVAGAYIEVSRPGMGFTNPNGNSPDPYQLTYATLPGASGQSYFIPVQTLPGWGIYSFRVIPLNAQGMPVGLFSNPSVLELRPFGFF